MQRLTSPLDVDFVTHTFFPTVSDPSDLNTGRCFLWAYYAFRLYDKVHLWDSGIHAFIRYRGKFYDSERSEGVTDWKDLPATNFGVGCGRADCRAPATKLTLTQFKDDKHWGMNARKRQVVWKDIDRQVEKVIDEIQLANSLKRARPTLLQAPTARRVSTR